MIASRFPCRVVEARRKVWYLLIRVCVWERGLYGKMPNVVISLLATRCILTTLVLMLSKCIHGPTHQVKHSLLFVVDSCVFIEVRLTLLAKNTLVAGSIPAHKDFTKFDTPIGAMLLSLANYPVGES